MALRRTLDRVRALAAAAAVIAVAVLSGLPAAHASEDSRPNSFGNASNDAPLYRVYTYRQRNGVPVFTDRVPAHQSYEIMEFSCYACDPNSKVNWGATRLFTREYATQINHAAEAYGVDPSLIRALIHAESGFNPRARSRKGAMGLMQLMPGTASDMGVQDAYAVQQNIEGGVKYLALLLDQFDGDITLATAAYNAGPGMVDRYNGIPPFPETQTYVRRVRLLHDRYRAQNPAQS